MALRSRMGWTAGIHVPRTAVIWLIAAFVGLVLPGAAFASEGSHAVPPVWAVMPFIILLGMIATGPLFYHHFWGRYYPHVSIALGLVVVAFYAFFMRDIGPIYHELMEYLSFILLLASLFVASGAILIEIDKKGTPLLNVFILAIGCVVANVIGTTGASMLLIRPFMRINHGRIKAYHIIFFIFLISNIGGALTPIGDPPLFMGFLRGIPFFWVASRMFLVWLFEIGMVLAVFFVIDTLNARKVEEATVEYSGGVRLVGVKSFIWLAIIIGAVFLDKNVIAGFPSLQEMWGIPFGIREIIMLIICFLAYRTADKQALRGNDFNFQPIKEVAYLFIGIFMTMVPALQLIAHEAQVYGEHLTPGLFFYATGSLSAVLDNTPTYLNFFTAALGKYSMAADDVRHVNLFIECPETLKYVVAISAGAVFWGSMTYIGNGPNFMVKSISDQNGVKCPSFFGYVFKYSAPILLPIFVLTWVVFFRLPPGNQEMIRQDCPEIYQIMQQGIKSPAAPETMEHGMLTPENDSHTKGVSDGSVLPSDRSYNSQMSGSRLAGVQHRQPAERAVSRGPHQHPRRQAAVDAQRTRPDHRLFAKRQVDDRRGV